MPPTTETIDYLDVSVKIATVLIAACNVFFAVRLFKIKNKRDDIDKEKDRKIQWLKTLILDHNLKFFYEFHESLDLELRSLKQEGLTDDQKEHIDAKIGDLFINLRRNFTDTLLAIDINLYNSIVETTDHFQKILTDTIFDQGINLAYAPKYDEVISEKIVVSKSEVLKKLFRYRG
jgi:hypothetical protein